MKSVYQIRGLYVASLMALLLVLAACGRDVQLPPPAQGQGPQLSITNPAEDGLLVPSDVDVRLSLSSGSRITAVRYRLNGNGFQTLERIQNNATIELRDLPSGQYTLEVIAEDEHGGTTTRMRTFTVDATPPTVTLTSHNDNAVFTGQVQLEAIATDAQAGVERVEFFFRGEPVGTATAAGGNSYTLLWNSDEVLDGMGRLEARAFDRAGNMSMTSVAARVSNTPEAPSVEFLRPIENATVRGVVDIEVQAVSNSGAPIQRVEFRAGNNLIGLANAPAIPGSNLYRLSWDSVAFPDGALSLLATAIDAANNRAEAAISVTVANVDTMLPTIDWISPNNGVTVGGVVPLTVVATDNLGISKVEFYAGSNFLGTGTAVGDRYHFDWDTTTLPDGQATLRVVASDQANNRAEARITVGLANAPRVTWIQPIGDQIGGSVPLRIEVDGGRRVNKVEYYANTVKIGEVSSADPANPNQYTMSWNSAPYADTTVSLRAVVVDSSDIRGEAAIAVTVSPQPPAVDIIRPTPENIVSGTITVVADARDPAGISRVVLLVNGSPFTEKTNAPYNFDLDTPTLENSPFTLQVYAENNRGIGAYSQEVALVADNLLAPELIIVAPDEDATLPLSFSVRINIRERGTPFVYLEPVRVEIFDYLDRLVATRLLDPQPQAGEDFTGEVFFDLSGNPADVYRIRVSTRVLIDDQNSEPLVDEVLVNLVVESNLPPALMVFAPVQGNPVLGDHFTVVGNVTDDSGGVHAVELRVVCDTCGPNGSPVNALLAYEAQPYGAFVMRASTIATPRLYEGDDYRLRVVAIDAVDQTLRNVQEIDVEIDRSSQSSNEARQKLRLAPFTVIPGPDGPTVMPRSATWRLDLSDFDQPVE